MRKITQEAIDAFYTVSLFQAVLNDIGNFVNMNDTCEEIFRNFAGFYGLEITESSLK